jgi:hypothetical protein
MRNCFPSAAAQIFICKGELRLEADALTFLSPWQTRMVIPLRDIEDLSIGQFQMWTTPWVMQYERLNYLSVTYRKDGRSETVHLTPVAPGAASARQINEEIGGWFEAIQKAVMARRGVAPRVTEPRAVTISAEPAWNRKGVPLFIALLAAFGLVVWRLRSGFGRAPEPFGMVVFGVTWLLLLAVIWFSIGFLRANYALKRGDLDAVTSDEPPEGLRWGFSGPSVKPPESFWVTVARWTARVLGTLFLAIYGLFVVGEGLPPVGWQPEGVQLSFVGMGMMLLGFLVGWRREGTAALLIGLGSTLWHISEGRITSSVSPTPLLVAAFYGFCWWATHGRRTRVVVGTVTTLMVALGLGRLFCPSSVFVRGWVTDAQTGKPLPNAELTLAQRSARAPGEEAWPNSRSGKDGRFALYVGWYAEQKRVSITAPGYATLTTNLGPRALGQRNVDRDYRLQRAGLGQERWQQDIRAEAGQKALDAARDFVEEHKWRMQGEWGNSQQVIFEAHDGGGRRITFDLIQQAGGMAQFTVTTEAGAQLPAWQIGAAIWRGLGWADASASAAEKALTPPEFGPVVERVLYSVAMQRPIKAEDLDGGREIEVPAELEKAREEQFFHWLAVKGADLLAFAHKRSWDLVVSPTLTSVSSTMWDQPAAADLLAALKSIPVGLERVESDAKEGFIAYRLGTNVVFPLTFAFQTAAGGLGVLQVTGLTESPRGVKIRYKLLTPSATSTSAPTTPAQAAQAPVARAEPGTFQLTLTNGVSVEVVAVTRNPLANLTSSPI